MSTTLNPTATAARAVAEARRWIGTPYRHQASVRGVGCDCLGLVRGVWRALHGTEAEALPAYTADWGEAAGDEPLLAAGRRHLVAIPPRNASAGDVLAFRWRAGAAAKHLGILSAPLAASPRFVHAWERAGVVEVTLAPCWVRRIAAVFRFPEINPT